MSMCESILTIALVCTVKYLHYCDYYYTLGNDSQSTPKLIAYVEIANYLSFSSQSHFIQLFKDFTGMTPKKYRDLHSSSSWKVSSP